MEMARLFLFLQFVVLTHAPSSANNEFCVSQLSGIDSSVCLAAGSTCLTPCRSLDFVLASIYTMPAISVAKVFVDGFYATNHSLIITRPHLTLQRLVLSGHGDNSVIAFETTSNVTDLGLNNPILAVGCLESKSCQVNFDLTLENLSFKNSSLASAAVHLVSVPNVIVRNCVFERNSNSSLVVQDSRILVENCQFLGRMEDPVYKKKQLAFFLRRGLVVIFTSNTTMHAQISSCNFTGLGLPRKNPRNLTEITRQNSWTFYAGGAVVVAFQPGTNCTVAIDDCLFHNNTAVFGGSVTIFAQDTVASSASIKRSIFRNSTAYDFGGAVAVEVRTGANRADEFQLHDSLIEQCEAGESGGGLRYTLHPPEMDNPKNMIGGVITTLTNVTFRYNHAPQGAGAYFTCNSADGNCGLFVPILIKDIRITNHHAPLMAPKSLTLTGPLVFELLNSVFRGMNMISNNTIGTGLILDDSFVFLDGSLYFYGNSATANGGGMSFIGVSFITMNVGADLRFERNYARLSGGAIFARPTPGLVAEYAGNPLCFLRYVNQTEYLENWKINLTFIDNGAGIDGGAMHSDTFSLCTHSDTFPFFNNSQVLSWFEYFEFSGNYLGDRVFYPDRPHIQGVINEMISSDVEWYIINEKEIRAYPGETVGLEILAYDELKTTKFSSPNIYLLVSGRNTTLKMASDHLSIRKTHVYTKPTFSYIMPHEEQYRELLESNETTTAVMHLTNEKTLLMQIMEVPVILEPCIPGYLFSGKLGKCVCDTSIPGVLRCIQRTIYLQEGYWANVSDAGKLITNYCPYGYCHCLLQSPHSTGCAFNSTNPDSQCTSGRQGVLCGACKPGHTVEIIHGRCVKCENLAAGLAVFISLVIVFCLACIAMVIFNPGFPQHLRGVIFFTQMIAMLLSNTNSTFISSVILVLNSATIYGMSYVGCISLSMTFLQRQMLAFVYPFIVVLLLLVFYILDRKYLITFRNRRTPFQALWTLMVFTYSSIIQLAFLNFFCVKAGSSFAYFYDGTVRCFTGNHLTSSIVSVFVVVFLVLPPPVLVVLATTGYLRVQPQVSDAITKGFRENRRWWWAVEFLRRIVLISIYCFTPDFEAKQVFIATASFFCCVAHVAFQPYTKMSANYTEGALLVFLTIISNLLIKREPLVTTINEVLLGAATLLCVCIVLYCFGNSIRKYVKIPWRRDNSKSECVINDQRVSSRGATSPAHPYRLNEGIHED